MIHLPKITLAMLFTFSFFLMNCDGNDDPVALPEENEIWMQDNVFNPSSLTVSPGTTITWVNKGNMAHTTTSNDNLWDSGSRNPGNSFTHTFQDEGSYSYRCTLHPGMNGQIVVQ